jgi:hypothetical protein
MVAYPFPSATTEALVECSTERVRRLYPISTPKDDTSTDAVFPPDLIDGPSGIGLFEDGYDLRLGKFRLSHENLLAGGCCARKFSL